MRLTPLDIRKQEFSRGLRGFDVEEVHAFLQMVSEQWEEVLDENRRRDEKIRDLENKMSHYEKVEEALQEALQTARDTARKARENAEERAALLLEQAEARAEEITRDAEQERHQIKRETAKLSGRRSEIVTRLRAFLMSELELLARYEGDDPVGFIRLLPGEEKRVHKLSERLGDQESEDEGREKPLADAGGRTRGSTGGTWPAAAPDEPGASEPERHVHDWTRSQAATFDVHPREEEGFLDDPKHVGADPHEDEPLPSAFHGGGSADYSDAEREAASYFADAEAGAEREGASGTRHTPEGPFDYYESGSARADEEPDSTLFRGEGADVRAHDQPRSGREGGETVESRGEEYAREEETSEEDRFLARPGWTTQTVVSRPSEHSHGPEPGDHSDDEDEDEDRTTRASSEEIEKIRRILSDLE